MQPPTVLVLLSLGSLGCQAESVLLDVPGEDPVLGTDHTVDILQGSWTGELKAIDPLLDNLELEQAEVLNMILIVGEDESDIELDVSIRFNQSDWWSGFGQGTVRNHELGTFDAVVHSPDGLACLIEGDWFTGTEELFMTLSCNSWEGEPSEYELEAGKF